MDYWGTAKTKYCPECKEKIRKRKVRAWQRNHRDKMNEYRKRYYNNNFNMKISKQEREKAFENLKDKLEKNKYCAAYDETQLSCIQCYENQVAKYKACKK